MRDGYWDTDRLSRVVEQRRLRRRAISRLGEGVQRLVDRVIEPRCRRLSALSQAWASLLPDELVAHSCPDSFSRGQLRVLVDSSSHLFELQMLLQEGLVDQLGEMCPGLGLSRVKLVRGQWYRKNEEGVCIVELEKGHERRNRRT